MKIYQDNIQKYISKASKLSQQINQLSALRIITFILSAALLIILAEEGYMLLFFLLAPICIFGFVYLIKKYNRAIYFKRHTDFLKEINELELLKTENKLSSFEKGENFIHRDHAYVADLDVFGSHSLFQLINRTTTEPSKIKLAEWLSTPASKEVILERQKAIQELSPNLDWRQDFQASGMHFENQKSEYNKLLTWIDQPEQLLSQRSKHLITAIILSLISFATLIYFLAYVFSPDWYLRILPLVISLIINSYVLKSIRPIAEETVESTFNNIKVLGGYQALIQKIENQSFNSPLLQKLQTVFRQDNYSAIREIKKLRKILEMIQQRGTKGASIGRNSFYTVFNKIGFLDSHLVLATEKWKAKNRPYLKIWGEAVSEFEVLNSLAGFYYANPSFTFPEILDEPYHIQFESLGHPLINSQYRVCNDYQLKGRGEIVMITGSNMAGKSTFLRSIGINLVLALMGAPCCAKSGQVSHLKVFTSMRTQDNLEEGVSSFYAELKRIEQLLHLITSGEAIFFLLDEMFKGTNSQDRYKGGVSLIKQLSELNAFGIISTHDLEMAKLAANHLNVTNYSFNSEIKEEDMIFNYKLTPGICRDFNASELMKRSGINILSNIEEI